MTLFEHAQRYVGEVKELPGGQQHPLIQWWLSLCGFGFDAADEIPWCSAFINGMAWDYMLPRTKSAAARSWLNLGEVIPEAQVRVGDVVILRRGTNPAQGHVGFYAGGDPDVVHLLAGNQGNTISIADFPRNRVLGIRRLT